jgi:hypothetical protein
LSLKGHTHHRQISFGAETSAFLYSRVQSDAAIRNARGVIVKGGQHILVVSGAGANVSNVLDHLKFLVPILQQLYPIPKAAHDKLACAKIG